MSEWGRTSTPTARPSRFPAFIFGILVGGAVAAGASWVGAPYLRATPPQQGAGQTLPKSGTDNNGTSAISEAQQRVIDELRRKLDEFAEKPDTADLEKTVAQMQKEAKAAEQVIAGMEAENNALRSELQAAGGSSATGGAPQGSEDYFKLKQELETKFGQQEAKLQIAEAVTKEMTARLDQAFNVEIPALKQQVREREDALALLDDQLNEEIKKNRTLSDGAAASGASEATEKLKADLKLSEELLTKLDAELSAEQKKNAELSARLETAEKAGASGAAVTDGGEIAKLKADLASRDQLLTKLDGELAAEQKKSAELLAKNGQVSTSAEKGSGPFAVAIAETISLREKVTKLESELASVRSKAEADRAALDAAKAGEAKAKAEQEQAKAIIAAAEAQASAKDEELQAAKARVAELDTRVKALAAIENANAGSEAKLRTEIAAATADRDRLAGELAALKSQLTALQSQAKEKDDAASRSAKAETGSEDAGNTGAATERDRTPRDPLLVAGVLQQVRGLEDLSSSERDAIATGLIEGECVSKTLTDAIGRAPALAIRDLIRALESDC